MRFGIGRSSSGNNGSSSATTTTTRTTTTTATSSSKQHVYQLAHNLPPASPPLALSSSSSSCWKRPPAFIARQQVETGKSHFSGGAKAARQKYRISLLYYLTGFLAVVFVYLQIKQMTMDVEMNVSITSKATANAKFASQSLSSLSNCRCTNGEKPRIAIATLFSGAQAESAGQDELEVVNCTKQTKIDYAQKHGYLFLDESNFSEADTLPLLPHMIVKDNPLKRGRFQKLQFLIQIFEKHDEIEWLLWMDSDAAITDTNTKLEDRLALFQKRFLEQFQQDPELDREADEDEEIEKWIHKRIKRKQHESKYEKKVRQYAERELRKREKKRRRDLRLKQEKEMKKKRQYSTNDCHNNGDNDDEVLPSMSMVIAHDHKGVNNGVFFIRNNEQGRRILITSYMTYVDPQHGYADQRAMTDGVLNRTATNSTLYLNVLEIPVEDAHLLQNYAIKRIKRNHPMWWKRENHPFSIHMPHSTSLYRKNFLGPKGQNICPNL